MTRWGGFLGLCVLVLSQFEIKSIAAQAPIPAPSEAPPIATLMKPAAYKKMIEERDIISYATLDRVDPNPKADPPLKKYRFYAGALIHASLRRTRTILTDYKVYSKIVPYIDKTDYSPEKALLDLQGSFLKYQLRSIIHFIEKTERWIAFKIVGGHFAGLTGNMYFEPQGDRGTAVYFDGEHSGWSWPPAFIVEKGAEIVFGFTARRMRSYVESNTYEENEKFKKEDENQSEGKKGKGTQKASSHLNQVIQVNQARQGIRGSEEADKKSEASDKSGEAKNTEIPRPKRRFEVR